MKIVLIIVAVFVLYHYGHSLKFKYQIVLDAEKSLCLKWTVNYLDENVNFQIKGKLKFNEWLAFGFSDYGQSKNADLVLYWKDDHGRTIFKDAHTDRNGVVKIDHTQNYFLSSDRKFKNDWFVLEFIRKIDTCDQEDYELDNGTTHIIVFSGFGSPKDIRVSSRDKAVQRVQILKPDIPEVKLPDDARAIDVVNPAIMVPSTETTYWWHITKLPDFKRKHHIIKHAADMTFSDNIVLQIGMEISSEMKPTRIVSISYEGIIQKGHEHLVHHMEVFHCEVDHDVTIPSYNGPGLAEGKPPGLSVCRRVLGAWAMGATAVTLPEEAGTPLGGDNWSRYVLLEVHYNNPQRKQGIKDSSGIRLYVTQNLRKYDSGIMELGLEYTDKMAIPPGQKIFSLTGYCIPECTEVGLPESGINIFASQLHTHLTGKRVFTKHIRNGQELPELNRDNHYSPHFQEIRRLPEPVRVLPGDSLITTCEDSTLNRRNITLGGFSISEEMCVNYVHYYPAVSLEVCKSSVDSDALRTFFKFMKRRYNDKTLPNQTVSENYNAITWSKHASRMLSTFYDIAPLSMQCNQSDGSRFPGVWLNKTIPKISHPMIIRKDMC